MALTDEQKETFAKGFNAFLERTEQSKTTVAELLGVTPQVTSGWSRMVSVPSYELCQKLLSLDKPMTVAEMFGVSASTAQTLELSSHYMGVIDSFEEIVLKKGRDLTIRDFQSGEFDYRRLIQDFVEVLVYLSEFPEHDRIEKLFKKAKKFPNIYEAIQSEMNWWKKSEDKES